MPRFGSQALIIGGREPLILEQPRESSSVSASGSTPRLSHTMVVGTLEQLVPPDLGLKEGLK
jgi:hypothetical protein